MLKYTLQSLLLIVTLVLLFGCGSDSDSDPDGDELDGDSQENPDGDDPDGDSPDGDSPDGDSPDGDSPDGDNPDGDNPDGDTDRDSDSDGDNDNVEYDSDGDLEPDIDTSPDGDTEAENEGDQDLDVEENEEEGDTEAENLDSACVRRVDVTVSPVPAQPDGLSWETAFTKLQAGIDAASAALDTRNCSSAEVWVAAGTYTIRGNTGVSGDMSNSLSLKIGVAVYGGFSGSESLRDDRQWWTNECVIDGEDLVYHVVSCLENICGEEQNDDHATLDGFTITGGMARKGALDTPGDTSDDGYTIEGNCGGGLFVEKHNPIISNCTFTGNSAISGGGACVEGWAPVFTNCLFVDNSADWHGGGLFAYEFAQPVIHNSTFVANTAGGDGGGISTYNTNFMGTCYQPTMANCIVWGNTPALSTDNQIFSQTYCEPLVSYSNVQWGWGDFGTNGNIGHNPAIHDPQFVATTGDVDYRLQSSSPSIDTGDNETVTIDHDLDGQSRTIDGNAIPGAVVDMGAYEYQPPVSKN